jgi:hypothetical protein
MLYYVQSVRLFHFSKRKKEKKITMLQVKHVHFLGDFNQDEDYEGYDYEGYHSHQEVADPKGLASYRNA